MAPDTYQVAVAYLAIFIYGLLMLLLGRWWGRTTLAMPLEFLMKEPKK